MRLNWGWIRRVSLIKVQQPKIAARRTSQGFCVLRPLRIHQNTLYFFTERNSRLQTEIDSPACGMACWQKQYKDYSSIHSWPSSTSEQMHRYLRCTSSETKWLTVFCLSLTANFFRSGAAAVVNNSVSLQLIMASAKRIGKKERNERGR